MSEILKLPGNEFCLQKWKKCGNITPVKYSSNKKIKNSKTKIYRSIKNYSLLY